MEDSPPQSYLRRSDTQDTVLPNDSISRQDSLRPEADADSVPQFGQFGLVTQFSNLQIGSTRVESPTDRAPQRRRESGDSLGTAVNRTPRPPPDSIANFPGSESIAPGDSTSTVSTSATSSTYTGTTAFIDYDLKSGITLQQSVASIKNQGIVT